jgi:hypothetical protein
MGHETSYAQFLPLPEDKYTDVFVGAAGDTARAKTGFLVSKIINYARYIMAAVAVLLGIIYALQMVLSRGADESYDKAKRGLLYCVIGLVIVALSSDFAKILDLTGGGLLGGPDVVLNRTRVFDDAIRILITFIKYIIGAVAVLMLIKSAAKLIIMGGNDEETGKEKKNIGYISIGLVLLIFVDSLIRKVFYKMDNPYENATIDVAQGVKEVIGFTNLLVTFVGGFAILMLVIGAVMYVGSFGNDETQTKAKKLMITSLIGIVVIYGIFGFVSTIIAGKF